MTSSFRRATGFCLAWAGFSTGIGFFTPLRADETIAELKPAAAQRQEWTGRLRTWDQVMAGAASAPTDPADIGIVLDFERRATFETSGRRTLLVQRAFKALDDAGVKLDGDSIVPFRKKDQRIYLIAAESIQPDGRHQPVQASAVFLETPQRQADVGIYDDMQELKVIFPDVKPGTITHLVYAIVDEKVRIPGRFCQEENWGYTWPIAYATLILDLPEKLTADLDIQAVGSGVPTPTITSRSGERSYQWEIRSRHSVRNEINRAPASQIGPAVHISNLRSWDDIAGWYQGLIDGRDRIGPKLEGEIRRWVAGAQGREEIVARIHRKVSDQVRYVGLEFGECDLQPHDCNEVWDNQYGDCKDKANLMAAALRHVGVPAYVTLVQTEYTGMVDRRVPSYSVFDHAIVAYVKTDGSYGFCDPTVKYSEAGMLSPADGDREVLVIRNGRADWVRTPLGPIEDEKYDFDLTVRSDGQISGWMNLTVTGSEAAWFHEHFAELDHDNARAETTTQLRGLFPNGQVIDLQEKFGGVADPFTLRAYFICPANAEISAMLPTLTFPRVSDLLTSFGDRPDRETGFYTSRNRFTYEVHFHLPANLQPATLPHGFDFDGPVLAIRADWSWSGRDCVGRAVIEGKQALILPSEFPAAYNCMQEFEGWTGQPVALASGGSAPAAETETIADLPIMPTGRGQLLLIERKYPESGDQQMRRAAVQQALTAFSDDVGTVFNCNVYLAGIDWRLGNPQAAYDRLSRLVADRGDQVRKADRAWAETAEAMLLRALHRPVEAAGILERLIADPSVADDRRVICGGILGEMYATDRPDEAIKYLTIAEALPGARVRLRSLHAHALLMGAKDTGVVSYLAALQAADPAAATDTFTGMLRDSASWTEAGDTGRADRLANSVRTLVDSPGPELSGLIGEAQRRAAKVRIASGLRSAAARSPAFADWLGNSGVPGSWLLSDIDQKIDVATKEGRADDCLKLELAALQRGIGNDYSKRLWLAAWYAEWTERTKRAQISPEVTATLLDLCDQLGPTDNYYWDGRFVRAQRERAAGRLPQEIALLNEMQASPAFPSSFRASLYDKLGRAEAARDNYAGALKYFREAEPLAADAAKSQDDLVCEILLDLNSGRDDDALRVIGILDRLGEPNRSKMTMGTLAKAFIALVHSGQARAFWASSRAWWPHWEDFATIEGLSDSAIETPLPILEPWVTPASKLANWPRLEALKQLASAMATARWAPEFAASVMEYADAMPGAFNQNSQARNLMLLEVLAGPQLPGLPELDRRDLKAILLEERLERYQDVLALARKIEAIPDGSDAVVRYAHYYHGLAVAHLKTDPTEAVPLLTKDLDSDEPSELRPRATLLLDRLYRQAGRDEDEENFLDAQTARTDLPPSTRAAVHQRLEELRGPVRFDRSLAAWLKKMDLPWYAQAEPESLDEADSSQVDAAINPASESLGDVAKRAKLLLLAAQSRGLPLSKREDAWENAIELLMRCASSRTDFDSIAHSVIDDSAMPSRVRQRILWATLFNAARGRAGTTFDEWRQHPLVRELPSRLQAELDIFAVQAHVDEKNSTQIVEAAGALTAGAIGYPELWTLDALIERATRLGDLEAIRRIGANSEQWNFADATAQQRERTELSYERIVRDADQWLPSQQAMIAVLQRRIRPPPLAPSVYDNRYGWSKFPSAASDETLAAMMHRIGHEGVNPGDYAFWHAILAALIEKRNQVDTVRELIHAGFSATASDDVRGKLVRLFAQGIDMDIPSEVRALTDECAAQRGSEAYPQVNAFLKVFDLERGLRSGSAIASGAATGTPIDRAPGGAQIFDLRVLARDGNQERLRSAVEEMAPEVLLDPKWIGTTFPMVRGLKLETETELARKVVVRELRRTVADSWIMGESFQVEYAMTLLYELNDSTLLDAAWADAMARRSTDPRLRQSLRLVKAVLARDWRTALLLSSALVRDYPTVYEYDWTQARALMNLHRVKDALEPLEIYCRFAHSDWEYPEAAAALARARAGAADPVASLDRR